MRDPFKEKEVVGFPVSEGVAIGKLFFLSEDGAESFPSFSINSDEVDREIQRYRIALSSSRKDLEQLQIYLSAEGSEEAITIIDTHIQMLEDPLITTFVEQRIHQMLQNTESVFRSVIGDYEKKFVAIDDAFFRQRWVDVKDVSQRILKHLHPKHKTQQMMQGGVFFAKELTPSHTAEACVSKVAAFISEIGGTTSHAALIARGKGIPYVANISFDMLKPYEGSIVIIDGIGGKIILNPSEKTLVSYQKLKDDIFENFQRLVDEIDLPTETLDHQKIFVCANIEKLSDLDHPHFRAADGVGLFRSEFLFMHKEIFSISEQEQFIFYSQMIKKAGDIPVVFRVFDLGGDKGFWNEKALEEPNPALGCRGIRFLLYYREFFKKQLRAFLRASIHGKVSLLFPLVADVQEIIEAKKLLQEAKGELRKEKLPYQENIPIGCMIEVPSAALTVDILAKESDFFSIGTNDLVQYTLAIDRAHPILSHGYKPTHPSIIRMMKSVVKVGLDRNKPVSVCGEIASNPIFTKLLIGLGITHLSCAPRHLPLIKKTIRSLSVDAAKILVEEILELESAEEIEKILLREKAIV